MSPRTRTTIGLTATAAFIATILIANYVTTQYGLIPVGFGLTATAGTYLAGLAFVLRDTINDLVGRTTVAAALIAGAALSYLISDPFIATASAVAFLTSETADWAVYEPLRKRGYLRAAIASNTVGTIVDTFLFLWIAGFGITAPIVTGQIVGKITITVAAVLVVLAARTIRNNNQAVTA